MSKYNWDLEKIKEIVPQSINFTEVLESLGIPRQGNNSTTLRNILDRNNIDYSHFTGRARTYNNPKATNIQDYLDNKIKIASDKLKKKLIKEGLKENKCEICGLTEWREKPIICQLHHIDGNHNNNSLDNLQILCPNCHSQTDNYCGQANKNNKKNYCKDCGKEISRKATYCTMCSRKYNTQISKIPPKEQLIQDFKDTPVFTRIGEKYEVTDCTIQKWFKKYNLPHHSKELKEYIKNLDI